MNFREQSSYNNCDVESYATIELEFSGKDPARPSASGIAYCRLKINCAVNKS